MTAQGRGKEEEEKKKKKEKGEADGAQDKIETPRTCPVTMFL